MNGSATTTITILVLASAAVAVPSLLFMLPAGDGDTLETYQASDSGPDVQNGSGLQWQADGGIFILAQSTIRDSDGRLVTYLESSKFAYLDMPALKSFLDYEASVSSSDPTVTIDGDQYQVIRRVQYQPFDSDGLVASTKLYDSAGQTPLLLARFAHDGYPVVAGDTLESLWTFVRPAVQG